MTEAQVMETKKPVESTLTAHDRCDRCGAQAYARTEHQHGDRVTSLLWCNHHAGEHKDLLVFVVDERHRLT